MDNDRNDRMELVAEAILRAIRDLIDNGNETTIEALLDRLEVYRLATNDGYMADLYRDAILVIKNGKV
ncbi:hypothetical protein CIG19_16780 [Enterobacterales bacterium CwR94]|nr:hypothetical protein CIG19_16780 [Enterobacterales bacterium CwR94]